MRLRLAVACLIGCLALAAGNPASYAPRTNTTAQVPSTGAIFTLYSDMQTYLGSAASCSNSNSTTLASVVSADEMAAINSLAVAFWSSDAGQAYLSAPASPPAQPGQPGSLGFWNASLFSGCVWIGMSNLNEPGQDTYAASFNSTYSLGFIDGAPTTAYVNNMRSGSPQSPVQVSGWRYYSQPPPVRNASAGLDSYATCAMLCPSWSSLQGNYGYTPIVMASCTTVALPYICKYDPAAALAAAAAATAPAASAPSSGHHRSLLSGGGGDTATASGPSYTQALAVAHDSHGPVQWPVWADPVNTSLGVPAQCYPGGLYDFCVFPDTQKHTQADWMYICWDAGLEPLNIDAYATLVTVMAAAANTTAWPGNNVQYVHTQAFIDANNPLIPSNLFTQNDFLAEYMAGHETLPGPNLPNGRVTAIPAYNTTGPAGQPQPGWSYITPRTTNTTCGPGGYGLGCAVAVVYVNGKAAGLAAISANVLAHGMCMRKRDAAMPRPDSGATPVVQLVLRLGITDNVTLQTLSDPLHSAADVATFVDALAKEAVPAALPGVAPEDVAVPLGPTTVLLFAPGTESSIYGLSSSGHRRLRSSAPAAAPSASTSSNSTGVVLNAQIGVMLQITLPYTVNTTDAINAYLENIMAEPTLVLSPDFVAKYHIADNSSAFVSAMWGNVDAPPPSSDDNMAVSVGVGVGIGIPAFGAMCYGLFRFFKDANATSQGYTKSKDKDEDDEEQDEEAAKPAKGKRVSEA